MQDYKLDLKTRTEKNKKLRRQLMESGGVLGNIYGRGFDSIAVAGEYRDVYKTVKVAGKNHPITISIDGKNEVNALVHEIEQDNITQKIHHVTFKVVIKGEKVKTDIPVHFIGESPAERIGLVVVKVMDTIHVESIPSKLPESFDVDLTKLEEDGDSFRISDLVVDPDVEILDDHESMLVRIETPRVVEEEEPEVELDEEGNPIAEVALDDDGNPIAPVGGEEGSGAEASTENTKE